MKVKILYSVEYLPVVRRHVGYWLLLESIFNDTIYALSVVVHVKNCTVFSMF